MVSGASFSLGTGHWLSIYAYLYIYMYVSVYIYMHICIYKMNGIRYLNQRVKCLVICVFTLLT